MSEAPDVRGVDPVAAESPKNRRDRVREAILLYQAQRWREAWDAALPLAQLGEREAQRLLGNVLQQGGLGHEDHAQARRWWSLSAAQRDVPAQFNLGLSLVYEAEPDLVEGLAWLEEAAQAGHRDAMQQLGTLLLAADRTFDEQARGYGWLRVAAIARDADAMGALGRAVQALGLDRDEDRLLQLREAAVQFTPPYAGDPHADSLLRFDRDERLCFFEQNKLASLVGEQGRRENAFEAHPDQPQQLTTRDTLLASRRLFRENESLPRNCSVLLLHRRGVSPGGVEGVPLAPAQLWMLVRPGDSVELSDGVNAHVTLVHSVDRAQGRIRFIDAWPDTFLLNAGLNVLGIEGGHEALGRTRVLCTAASADFQLAVRAILTEATDLTPQMLELMLPQLRRDAVAQAAFATLLTELPSPSARSEGLGSLLDVLQGRGPEGDFEPALAGEARAAAIDHAWLTLRRLRSAGVDRAMRRGGPSVEPCVVPLESAERELTALGMPTFESIPPTELAEWIDGKLAQSIEERRHAQRPARQGVWKNWLARLRGSKPAPPPSDAADEARALLERALERHPDSEVLLLRQAQFQRAEEDRACLAALDALIGLVDQKLGTPGPLVRNLEGLMGGVATERKRFAEFQGQVLWVRAEARLHFDDPSGSVADLRRIIGMEGGNQPEVWGALRQASLRAGDASLAKEAEAREGELKSRRYFERVLGVRAGPQKTE